MITLKQCMAHLSDCEALAAQQLTLRRQPRFWLSAMPGPRCMTRFANTRLSLAKKMLLQRIRGSRKVVACEVRPGRPALSHAIGQSRYCG